MGISIMNQQSRNVIAVILSSILLYLIATSHYPSGSEDWTPAVSLPGTRDFVGLPLTAEEMACMQNITVHDSTASSKQSLETDFEGSSKSKQRRILIPKPLSPNLPTQKANAVFVMLVRNKDLHGARSTIRQIEDRFNRNYQYPYVFLSNEEFTPEFKSMMRPISKAEMTFGLIPREHWSYPEWISQEKAALARRNMTMQRVHYGGSESYRFMCRYQSGLFFKHEAMLQYDYYWRIEPDVKYTCDIDFDPFLFMEDNNKKYAFTVSLYEYPNTIPTLWSTVRHFVTRYPDHLAKDNALSVISDDGGETYNLCHFWSNFEIADARWMRGKAYQQFFEHLDRTGGFFYERWGDAPVHSIAAALLLPIRELHFFKEIGYYHPPFYNCPAESELQMKCHCDPVYNINREYPSCTAKFLEKAGERRMLFPEEVYD